VLDVNKKEEEVQLMKTVAKSQWLVVVALALLIPLTVVAAEKKQKSSPEKQMIKASQAHPQAYKVNKKPVNNVDSKGVLPDNRPSTLQKQNNCLSKPENMPIYRPPLRGAPAGRVAGGTRGFNEKLPYLCALVPDHVGLTVETQPCLYYFLAAATDLPLEFTIIEKNAVYPLLETRIRPPHTAGIHAICLADYGKHLEQGLQYRWFVALVPDEEHRSRDMLAAGAVELVVLQSELKEILQKANSIETAFIYAEKGVWYDALTSLSAAIEKKPEDSMLAKQRAFLLEQVGLSDAARYESQRLAHN
jgi:hypothetical protein